MNAHIIWSSTAQSGAKKGSRFLWKTFERATKFCYPLERDVKVSTVLLSPWKVLRSQESFIALCLKIFLLWPMSLIDLQSHCMVLHVWLGGLKGEREQVFSVKKFSEAVKLCYSYWERFGANKVLLYRKTFCRSANDFMRLYDYYEALSYTSSPSDWNSMIYKDYLDHYCHSHCFFGSSELVNLLL